MTRRSQAKHATPGEYLTMAQAGRCAPSRVCGGTVWRWVRVGVLARNGQRIHLRSVRIGRSMFTTMHWLEQFWDEVAQADLSPRPVQREAKSTGGYTLLLSHELADAELREAGM